MNDAAAGAGPVALSERFLTGFHDARPGLTAEAFAPLPLQAGDGVVLASSYEALVADARAALADRADGRVLDLACGDGYLLGRMLQTLNPGVVLQGVDLSAGELQAARVRLGDRIALWRARAQALPLPAGSLDIVTCHMALMLMEALDQVIDEIHRVLRPGGTLAAVVGAPAPPCAATEAFRQALRTQAPQARWQALRLGDPRMRSSDGIVQALGRRFQRVEVRLLRAQRRLSPEALWHWYERMYDLELLHPDDRQAVRQRFLNLSGAAVDPDGLMLHSVHLHHCTAC